MRLAILLVLAAGCSPAAAPPRQTGPACVALAFASLAPRGPAPGPQKCCGKCNNTGKVRTGDGVAIVDCGCPADCSCKPKAAPKAVPCPTGTCPLPTRVYR